MADCIQPCDHDECVIFLVVLKYVLSNFGYVI